MQGDREHSELISDATNRSLEVLSRIGLPNFGNRGSPNQSGSVQVDVNLSKGADYQKLYNQYSQGVEASSPVNKTLAVAQNAARDGQKAEVIVNILRNDSKAQQFGEKSEQFIKTVTQAAVRKTQAEQFGGLTQQRQKTPTVER